MQKTIEVKPKFLLVISSGENYRSGKEVMEFEDEKELRAAALKHAEDGSTVKAYKVSSIAKATSYAALNLKWK